MLESPAETPNRAAPETRPSFGTGTLIAVGVWATVFVTFAVLGLRT